MELITMKMVTSHWPPEKHDFCDQIKFIKIKIKANAEKTKTNIWDLERLDKRVEQLSDWLSFCKQLHLIIIKMEIKMEIKMIMIMIRYMIA